MRTEVPAESLATEALTWIVAIIVLAALLPIAVLFEVVNQIQQAGRTSHGVCHPDRRVLCADAKRLDERGRTGTGSGAKGCMSATHLRVCATRACMLRDDVCAYAFVVLEPNSL